MSSVPEYPLVFVDWAGDPGFAFKHGSSKHLIVAAVFTNAYSEMRERLGEFRQSLGLAEDFHFHHASSRGSIRLGLRSFLRELPYAARVVVVEKSTLPNAWRAMRGDKLVSHFVAKAVLEAPRGCVAGALVVIDGDRGNRKQLATVRTALSQFCRERSLPYRPARVKMRPSTEEDGLQVADALAGLVMEGLRGGTRPAATIAEKMQVIKVPDDELA